MSEAKRMRDIKKDRTMFNMGNKNLTPFSKSLRKNMTKEERHLWYDFLKSLPVTIHRQKTIGNYIVDFYCHSAKLVIELDGSQHYEDKGKIDDIIRDRYLSDLGLKVLRYTNLDINRRFEAVCEEIFYNIFNKNE